MLGSDAFWILWLRRTPVKWPGWLRVEVLRRLGVLKPPSASTSSSVSSSSATCSSSAEPERHVIMAPHLLPLVQARPFQPCFKSFNDGRYFSKA
ncbi:hypothetical protein CRUP_038299 [Coryphaenoides rupestris]|nr:hypothetical protein CRUP_038299 [Coryphaenoides rupestris]